ncbi:hypothetical protein ACWEQP_30900 [Streptomyces sp. NPDC004044]
MAAHVLRLDHRNGDGCVALCGYRRDSGAQIIGAGSGTGSAASRMPDPAR